MVVDVCQTLSRTCDVLLGGDCRSFREKKLLTMQANQTLHFQWALRSTKTAAELKNELRQFIDDGDRIVVAEIGAEWASRRALANLGEMYTDTAVNLV